MGAAAEAPRAANALTTSSALPEANVEFNEALKETTDPRIQQDLISRLADSGAR